MGYFYVFFILFVPRSGEHIFESILVFVALDDVFRWELIFCGVSTFIFNIIFFKFPKTANFWPIFGLRKILTENALQWRCSSTNYP